MRKLSLSTIFLSLIIILSPFGNIAFQSGALGILGAFASTYVVMAYVIYIFIQIFRFNSIAFYTATVLLYLTAVSLVYLPFLEPFVAGQSTIVAGLKLSIIYVLLGSMLIVLRVDVRYIYGSSIIALFLCVLSLFYFKDVAFINFYGIETSRPRGYAMETSHFAVVFGCLTLLAYALAERTAAKSILFMLGAAILFYSQSKAGLFIYSIAFIMTYACSAIRMKKKVWPSIFVGVLVLIMIFIVLPFMREGLVLDIEEYSSTATRVGGVLSAILLCIKNPFGVGVFGYYDQFREIIPKAVSLMSDVFPSWHYGEIYDYYVQQGLTSIGSKSFFFDALIIGGLPMAFLLFRYGYTLVVNIIRQQRYDALPSVLFSIFSLLFWNSGVAFYIIFLSLGVISRVLCQEKS